MRLAYMNTTWLAGLFDGAGQVSMGDRVRIVFTRPKRHGKMMLDLKDFLITLGYHPTGSVVGDSVRVMIGRKREVEELARILSSRVKSTYSQERLATAIEVARR